MLHAQINISKDDLHVSAWLWTLPLTEEKKNGFPFVTDGEELKNCAVAEFLPQALNLRTYSGFAARTNNYKLMSSNYKSVQYVF